MAFQDPEVVRAELKAVLPPELFAQVDFTTLTPLRNRSTHDDLSETTNDTLYRVRVGGAEAYVWFLMEHQSTADRLMGFRLLRYMVGAWNDHIKGEGRAAQGSLPLIIPVVVLHDPDGRTAPTRFAELYDAPGWLLTLVRPLAPDFTYLVDDLMSVDHDTIEGRSRSAVYRLALWLLRTRGNGEENRFAAYVEAWEALAPEHKSSFVEAFLRYVVEVSSEAEPMPLRAAMAASPRFEEAIVTYREQLEQRGEQRGLEKGIQLGQAAMLLAQLTDKFGTLPDDVTSRLNQGSDADLKRWAHRILRADTLVEVFDDA